MTENSKEKNIYMTPPEENMFIRNLSIQQTSPSLKTARRLSVKSLDSKDFSTQLDRGNSNSLETKYTTPVTKTVVIPKKYYKSQNQEEIYANTFLKTQYVVMEIINIINEDLMEYVDALPILELIFNKMNISKKPSMSSPPQILLKRQRRSSRNSRNSRNSHNSNGSRNSSLSNKKRKIFGGDGDCMQNFIWCLEYGIPDTLHDFGKSRNYVFPSTAFGTQNKTFSLLFLEKAKEFLKPNYEKNFSKGIFDNDILYPIYEKNSVNFEEEAKTKYLLGFLCDKIDNVSYYFSEENTPNTWNEQKKAFFIENVPNKLNDAFYEVIQNFQYYILDACMSVHKEEKFKSAVKQITTLSNLWDPAGTGEVENINDGDEEFNLMFVPESFNKNILNSVMRTNQKMSFYDEIYNPLLNMFCLEDYGITIKLRLAYENKYYKIALVVDTPQIKNRIFILENGGFSVNVLSVGLYYVETDKVLASKINGDRNKNSWAKLKEIIDFVMEQLKNTPIKQKKRLLYILLTRFKSTGDHGSALSTKFINEQLGRPTIYLTGDQLAYVYSISQKIPTLFRFFNGKGDDVDEEDEEEDDYCPKERTHFLGLYSGNTNEIELTLYKYKTICEFFKDYNLTDESFIDIEDTIQYIKETNTGLKEKITEMSSLNLGTLEYERTKTEIENMLSRVTRRIFIDEEMIERGVTPEIKTYLFSFAELRNYYFILKYVDKFKVELQKQLKAHVEDYTNIVKINADEIFNGPNIAQRRSLREKFVQITNFGVRDFYKSVKTENFSEFVRKLGSTIVDEKSSFLDKIIEIKNKMKNRCKQVETFAENELSISASSLKSVIKNVFDMYKNKLIEKTKNVENQTIKDFFISLMFEKSTSELKKENNSKPVSPTPALPPPKTTTPAKKAFFTKTVKKVSKALTSMRKTVKNITKKRKLRDR